MELCDQYIHESIIINPTLNDYFKFPEYNNLSHILPNFWCKEYEKSTNNLDDKYLKLLYKKKNLNLYDKVLKRGLVNSLKFNKFKIYDYLPISSGNNIFYTTVDEINGDFYFKINTNEDIKNYMKRLKSFNPITESIIDCFKDGVKNNVTMYYRNVDYIIETLQNMLKNKSYEYTSNKKNITLKKQLNECINEYFVKNVSKLVTFLTVEYYPNTTKKLGLCQYKGGKDLYRLIIKDYLYDFATPENIHELGKSEVDRVFKEIQELKEKYKREFEKYEKNYKNYTEKELFSYLFKLRKELYKNNEKYFHNNLKPNELYDIKPILGKTGGSAYYYPSDFQRKKKGTFYINSNYSNFNNNELLTLSLHEGIPGHHYQIERNLNNPKIPLYLKYYDSTAYVEGWGLYCENLYDYKNIFDYYQKLKYELLRSSRLVIDTGIHFYGWTREDCLKYRDKYLPKSVSEYKRYIDTPGQALCYKVGELTLHYLKAEYLEKNPNGIKDFHELILDIGPVNLDLLIDEFKKKYICKI